MLEETSSGGFCSNDGIIHMAIPTLPFGGVGRCDPRPPPHPDPNYHYCCSMIFIRGAVKLVLLVFTTNAIEAGKKKRNVCITPLDNRIRLLDKLFADWML